MPKNPIPPIAEVRYLEDQNQKPQKDKKPETPPVNNNQQHPKVLQNLISFLEMLFVSQGQIIRLQETKKICQLQTELTELEIEVEQQTIEKEEGILILDPLCLGDLVRKQKPDSSINKLVKKL
ncbi:17765_t:CDS:2, partial [Cetraspora pellucida]